MGIEPDASNPLGTSMAWFSSWLSADASDPKKHALAGLARAWPHGAAIARAGKVVVCNTAFADLAKLQPSEVVGLPWSFVLGAEPSAASDPFPCTIGRRPYLALVVVVGEEQFVTVRDVSSDFDERTDEVANARQEVLNTAVFSLAHDLRNALTGVTLNLELLRAAPGEEQEAIIADCLASTGLMSDMLSDLQLKGIDRATNEFEPRKVVRAALRLVRHQIPPGTDVAQDLEPTPNLHGSAARLTQAVMNLLVNAGDACRTSKCPGRIKIAMRYVEPNVLIEVHDSGAGVPPALRAAIQATYFSTKGSQGSGMGLAITRRVTGEFGGSLAIGDSPLGGALFTLTLQTGSP